MDRIFDIILESICGEYGDIIVALIAALLFCVLSLTFAGFVV